MKGFYKIFITICFFIFSLLFITSTAQCQSWSPYQSPPININLNLGDFPGSFPYSYGGYNSWQPNYIQDYFNGGYDHSNWQPYNYDYNNRYGSSYGWQGYYGAPFSEYTWNQPYNYNYSNRYASSSGWQGYYDVPYSGYGWNQPYFYNRLPQGPYFSYDEPAFGHDNTKNPYASDALWNLNWDLEDTDITLNCPDDGEAITAHVGETIGFILPNHGDNYDADVEWVLDEDELDENIVEKISDERFPGYWYNGGVRPVFEDGREQWIFEAIGTGTTTIKLDCINREDDNTGTIEIEVKVKD